jgi:hypothetical protein
LFRQYSDIFLTLNAIFFRLRCESWICVRQTSSVIPDSLVRPTSFQCGRRSLPPAKCLQALRPGRYRIRKYIRVSRLIALKLLADPAAFRYNKPNKKLFSPAAKKSLHSSGDGV